MMSVEKSTGSTTHGSSKHSQSMFELVRDVHSSNKIILQKLNEAVSNTGCLCDCHSKQKQKEYEDLQSVIEVLQLNSKRKDEEIRQLHEQLKALWDIVQRLEKLDRKYEKSRGKLQASRQSGGKQISVGPKETSSDENSGQPHGKSGQPYVQSGQPHEKSGKPHVQSGQPDNSSVQSHAESSRPHLKAKRQTTVQATTESSTKGMEIKLVGEKESNKQNSASDYLNTARPSTPRGIKNQANSVKKEITAPNMKMSGPAKSSNTVEVIHQTTTENYLDNYPWLKRASDEQELGQSIPELRNLGGAHTVLLLDISASMVQGDGWKHTMKFCQDYLNGLANLAAETGNDEHVAIVTFGHECRVVSRFTNKMADLLKHLESVKLGGPSPMYGGLYLAYASATVPEKKNFTLPNGVQICGKIIVLTDGRPTNTFIYEGPDIEDNSFLDQSMAHLCDIIEKICSGFDLYFVPVGNSNMEFFQQMKEINDLKIVSREKGVKMSRRLYVASQIKGMGLLSFLPGFDDGTQFSSQSDKELADEIKQEIHKRVVDGFMKQEYKMYRETKDPQLLTIGTRVRRGPDWDWKEQDSNGPGTVIGHDVGSQVWVHWDINDHQNVYRYGNNDFDVLPVDEPRIICDTDKLQVGCVVKPGKDWKGGSQAQYDRGVVIRSVSHSKYEVRWQNGKRDKYAHEVRGEQEVVYCAPDAHLWPSQGGYKLGDGKPVRKNKNKNS